MAYECPFADMAELADAPDLGSGVFDVEVQVLLSAPRLNSSNFLCLKERSGYFAILKSLKSLRYKNRQRFISLPVLPFIVRLL